MDESRSDQASDGATDVPLARVLAPRWPLSSNKDTVFANMVLAQHQDGAFIISFGMVLAPNPYNISREDFGQLTQLPVDVVARVVLTPEKMREVIEVLSENYRKWSAAQGQPATAPREDEDAPTHDD